MKGTKETKEQRKPMNKAIFTQSSLIRVNLLGVVVIINEHDCLRYADPMQASA